MLERRTGNCYRIVKIFSNQVLLARNDDPRKKYLYREFSQHTPQTVELLQKLRLIRHPSLLQLCDVLCSQSSVGVYCQYYSCNLQEQLQRGSIDAEEETVLNTLYPVRQAIEELHKQNIFPAKVAPRNIVVTEDGDVKFMDEVMLLGEGAKSLESSSSEQNYAGLLEIGLMLTEGNKPDSGKSIAYRFKRAKQRLGRSPLFNFLSQIRERTQRIPRVKRIRKRTSVNNENKERANPRGKLAVRSKCQEGVTAEALIKPLN